MVARALNRMGAPAQAFDGKEARFGTSFALYSGLFGVVCRRCTDVSANASCFCRTLSCPLHRKRLLACPDPNTSPLLSGPRQYAPAPKNTLPAGISLNIIVLSAFACRAFITPPAAFEPGTPSSAVQGGWHPSWVATSPMVLAYSRHSPEHCGVVCVG